MILQIETATTVCSVALSKDGETIAVQELNEPNVHAAKLTLLIEALMAGCSYTYTDLDAVAVSVGPGSYTGLRIGVSTAKGLCYAADLPVITVPTLEAMAHGYTMKYGIPVAGNILLAPMVDARRMEVYTTLFNPRLEAVTETTASIIDEYAFDQYRATNRLVLFGNGADKFTELFSQTEYMEVSTGFLNSAAHMSGIAARQYTSGMFDDVAYFDPYYLKDFVPTQPKNKYS